MLYDIPTCAAGSVIEMNSASVRFSTYAPSVFKCGKPKGLATLLEVTHCKQHMGRFHGGMLASLHGFERWFSLVFLSYFMSDLACLRSNSLISHPNLAELTKFFIFKNISSG